jgi:cytochrome c-type biogenesis protein CcmH/NrfG
MRILSYRDCLLPLLELVADGQPWTVRRAAEVFAERVELTDAERQKWQPSTLRAYVSTCVGRAKTRLIQAGLLEKSGLGKMRISELGRQVLAHRPAQITDRDINSFRRSRTRVTPGALLVIVLLVIVSVGVGWMGVIFRGRNAGRWFDWGVAAYQEEKDFELAIDCFSRVIRLDPKWADGYYWRGMAHLNRGEYDEAIADHTEAIRLDPEWAEPYCGRGVAQLGKGNLDEAIADFTEAIRLDPKWETYARRGVAYSKKGDYQAAIADFTEVIRLNPKQPQAYSARAEAYRASGDEASAESDEAKAQQLREGQGEAAVTE